MVCLIIMIKKKQGTRRSAVFCSVHPQSRATYTSIRISLKWKLSLQLLRARLSLIILAHGSTEYWWDTMTFGYPCFALFQWERKKKCKECLQFVLRVPTHPQKQKLLTQQYHIIEMYQRGQRDIFDYLIVNGKNRARRVKTTSTDIINVVILSPFYIVLHSRTHQPPFFLFVFPLACIQCLRCISSHIVMRKDSSPRAGGNK